MTLTQGSSGASSTVTLTPSMVRSPTYFFIPPSRPLFVQSRGDIDLARNHPHHVPIPVGLGQRAGEHYLATLQHVNPVDIIGNVMDVGFGDQHPLAHGTDRGDACRDQGNDGW